LKNNLAHKCYILFPFVVGFSFVCYNGLYQWFSTFFGWRHIFHQKNFCGTQKTGKILKITSKNLYFCIKLLGFKNCHDQKWLKVGKIEIKSEGKIFGGTPRRSSRHTGWETLVYLDVISRLTADFFIFRFSLFSLRVL